MIKIAIVGSRNFPRKCMVDLYLDIVCFGPGDDLRKRNVTIISGGCKTGPDLWAKEFALLREIPYIEFLPNPNISLGNKRYIDRNKQIAEYSDRVVAFYSGTGYRNSGTLSTVEFASQLGKAWRIIGPHDKI
jgi:hypothetical protein